MHRPRPFVLAALALAAVFAAMALLPAALQRGDEAAYGGVPVLMTTQMRLEAARAQEVLQGNWLAGSPLLAEGKDAPAFRLPLEEGFVALSALLTGSDSADAYVAVLGVLAFSLFLLAASFLTRLTRRPWASLAAICLVLPAAFALLRPEDLPVFASGGASFAALSLSPSAGLLWILCWLFATLRLLLVWNALDSRKALAGAAACAAVTLSLSPAAGASLGIGMLLVFLSSALRKDMRRVKELLGFFALFLFLSIPYGVLPSKVALHPLYAESAPRLGILPLGMSVTDVRALLPVLAAVLGWKLWGVHRRMVLCLAAGASLAFCLPLLTGVRTPLQGQLLESLLPFGLPLAAMAVAAGAVAVVRSRMVRAAGWGIVVMVSVLLGMQLQHTAYAVVRPDWAELQDLAPVLRALQAQEPGVAHVQGLLAQDLVAAHTAHDVTAADGAVFSLQPAERLRDAYFFELWLGGLLPGDAAERFWEQWREEASYRLHGLHYAEQAGTAAAIPDDVLQRHAAAYRDYAARTDAQKLCLHPADYLILSGEEPETAGWAALTALGKPLAQSGKFSLYALDRPAECPRPVVPGGR